MSKKIVLRLPRVPAVPVADVALAIVLAGLTFLLDYVWQPQSHSLWVGGFKQVMVGGLAFGTVFFFSLAADYWLMIGIIKRGSRRAPKFLYFKPYFRYLSGENH